MQEPLGTRTAFHGHVIRVDIEDWPGLPSHDVVRHPGAAAVLPLTPEGGVLLVKQFRPAVRQELTES
jgi:ADP-ribose pyrophosphatase